MKYSLRKSFNSRRQNEPTDDEHVYPRLDPSGFSTSNSNLVKKDKKNKSFLRRNRRYSSSPPPPSPPLSSVTKTMNIQKSKSKTLESGYSSHINDDNDDDDDPFTAPNTNNNNRTRPFDRLTYQIRKSFRNTLTRQRSRLESSNSNKRLLFKTNESQRPSEILISSISTGITSQIVNSSTLPLMETPQIPVTSKKRRRAPLAPSQMQQSQSVPNPDCSTLIINDNPESGYNSSANDVEKDSSMKKSKSNQSIRTRISLLLKKRHEKRQQIPSCIDEEFDHQPVDDEHEANLKKVTLGQRFDTFRRSLHLGKRNSTSKGKSHLLLNE